MHKTQQDYGSANKTLVSMNQTKTTTVQVCGFLKTFYFKIISNLQANIKIVKKKLPYIFYPDSLPLIYCDIYCIF